MQVKDVLARKGAAVATIGPDSSVVEVIASLSEHGVGALVVSGNGRTIEGIVSERDVVRALNTFGVDLFTMTVHDIRTADVYTCVPTDEIRSVARTMTDKRFRHMPVTVDGVLAGIVSIGDLVKSRVDELETEHDQLIGYISSG